MRKLDIPYYIYCVNEHGGEWEDKYETVRAAFYSPEKAKETRDLLEEQHRVYTDIEDKLYRLGVRREWGLDDNPTFSISEIMICDAEDYDEDWHSDLPAESGECLVAIDHEDGTKSIKIRTFNTGAWDIKDDEEVVAWQYLPKIPEEAWL